MEASIPKVIEIALRIIQANPDMTQKIITDFVNTTIIK